jgi:hypothetical protein
MLFDPTVSDASFVDGRPPKDIKQIIEWTREQLGLDGERPWTLISARTKLGRVLFEIEEETSFGPRRFIGKLGSTERALILHRTLVSLRSAGFQPPSKMTVPEPVVCLPERGLVLQEKVPGRQASELILQSPGRATITAADCARWLAALHQSEVPADPGTIDTERISQWLRELSETQPEHAARLDRIGAAVFEELARDVLETVPCHGDFHPLNVLVMGTQRVTGIDMDKFGAREAEADIGWFLMQTAAFGFFKTGTFNSTELARSAFVKCYEAEMGRQVRLNRAALHMAIAFLKNLHFELVLLKTDRTEYAGPWLGGAASAILEGDIYLSANS